MEEYCISHLNHEILPALVRDYLDNSSHARELAAFSSDWNGLEEAVNTRHFNPEARGALVDVLSKEAANSPYATALVREQIASLSNENTYTITTGHQLCLYGGPMFFMYKILSTIHVANKLKERFPDKHFVPVFWMASEDHDFPEVNHIYLKDKKIEWSTGQKGKVGAFKLTGIEAFHQQVQEVMGFPMPQKTLEELTQIYSPDKTLAQATMDFAYWVFADHGLVVLDPDHRKLKEVFRPVMQTELREGFSEKAVTKTNELLISKGYKLQVSPRGINMFWIEEGKRERILATDSGFALADGSREWSTEALYTALANQPESFSPNVVLRPVYQETILPNIAYIGGPGELSYWLQLKEVFDQAGVPYPAVVLRDMFYLCEEKDFQRLQECGLELKDVFLDQHEQFKKAINQKNKHDGVFEEAKKALEETFSSLSTHVMNTDVSLQGSIEAKKTIAIKELEDLKKKVFRAEKRKEKELQEKISALHHVFFLLETPRERTDNWLNYSINPQRISSWVLKNCNPGEGVGFLNLKGLISQSVK